MTSRCWCESALIISIYQIDSRMRMLNLIWNDVISPYCLSVFIHLINNHSF